LKSSSERTLLNVFSTQTKRIVFVRADGAYPDIMTASARVRIPGSSRP